MIFPRLALSISLVAVLAACAGSAPPTWQMNAKSAMERATIAYMEGNARVEAQEFALARQEVARTGRADLMARIELTRCASRVASLVMEDCTAFEKLRPDATASERAYADYLAGSTSDIALLPPQHRAVASASSDVAAAKALQKIDDPLAQLVAAGSLFRASRATPDVLTLAVNTASAQGWRRPLLAWLGVQALRAENVGDVAEAQRVRRRISLVQDADIKKQP